MNILSLEDWPPKILKEQFDKLIRYAKEPGTELMCHEVVQWLKFFKSAIHEGCPNGHLLSVYIDTKNPEFCSGCQKQSESHCCLFNQYLEWDQDSGSNRRCQQCKEAQIV
jgi:hypothetical protein